MSFSVTQRDWAQLNAKLEAEAVIADELLEGTVTELAKGFVTAVDILTPKDTNRLANGWIDAGRDAGITDQPLHELKASSSREQFLQALADEITHWQRTIEKTQRWMDKYIAEDATRQGRRKKNGRLPARRQSQPFFRKMKRVNTKAIKRRDRVLEELAKAEGSEHFIFFDAERFVQRKQGRNFSTVREKIYGGEGSVIIADGEVLVELVNKEPHAKIVEKHPHLGHPVATAKAIMKTHGMSTAGNRFRKELRKRSGFKSA